MKFLTPLNLPLLRGDFKTPLLDKEGLGEVNLGSYFLPIP
jgi:hypothetical protein